MHDVGIHPGLLRAIGPGEGAAGGFLFVGDPLMGPAIGAALTLFAGNAKWCWRATSQQTVELTRQSGMALAASIKSLYHSLYCVLSSTLYEFSHVGGFVSRYRCVLIPI